MRTKCDKHCICGYSINETKRDKHCVSGYSVRTKHEKHCASGYSINGDQTQKTLSVAIVLMRTNKCDKHCVCGFSINGTNAINTVSVATMLMGCAVDLLPVKTHLANLVTRFIQSQV